MTESAGAAIELLALLPWGHNLVLLQKLKELNARLWYARAALEYGWSRSVLLIQIESRLHKLQGRAITNFTANLPPPKSEAPTADLFLIDLAPITKPTDQQAVDLFIVEQRFRMDVPEKVQAPVGVKPTLKCWMELN